MANRHPIALFQHRRLKEFPRSGGVSVVAIAEPVDSLLADHAMRLLKALEWEGVAMVEFRVDRPTQRVALMEVNGRYWGSLQLSILAGVDFPWYQWQVAHAQSSDVPVCYRTGVTARWTHGALQRLSTRREEGSRFGQGGRVWPRGSLVRARLSAADSSSSVVDTRSPARVVGNIAFRASGHQHRGEASRLAADSTLMAQPPPTQPRPR